MHYCYSCNRNVNSTIKMIRESYRDGNGNHVNTSKVIRVCDRCGKEIPDNKINDCGVQHSFKEYQKKILDKYNSKRRGG